MKTFVRILSALLLMAVLFAFSGRQASASEGGTYTISVTGGYATDLNGNTITEAAAGTEVQVFRTPEEGKYWQSWKTNLDVQTDFICLRFTMPQKNVTISAVTTTRQQSLTLDLTRDFTSLSKNDRLLVTNALHVLNGCKMPGYAYPTADLDQDGNVDFKIWPEDENANTLVIGADRRETLYSLGVNYSVSVPEGQIGTLTVIVDNKKSNRPVLDTTNGEYTITVKGATATGFQSLLGEQKELTELKAYPGAEVNLGFTLSDKNSYIVQCEAGEIGNSSFYNDHLDFIMPAKNVTINVITATRNPLEVDLRSGSCKIAKNVNFCEAVLQASGIKYHTSDYNLYEFDMDKDGTVDIGYDYKTKTVTLYDTIYSKQNSSVTYDGRFPYEFEECSYWPVTFVFNDNVYYSISERTLSNSAESIGTGGSVEVKLGDSFMSAERATADTELRITIEKTRYDYPLKEYYYMAGEQRVEFDPDNVTDGGKELLIRAVMPSADFVLVCYYEKEVKVTPTPVPDVSKDPVGPTGTPGNDTNTPGGQNTTKKGGSLPLDTILLIVIIVMAIGFGIVVILLKKKDEKANHKTFRELLNEREAELEEAEADEEDKDNTDDDEDTDDR